ncbi:MAG: PLP-dependent cysteine synthase family protein [Firmicutes bacterium]|nr:PLP-dependent cysteine synthase family protein [Bacillota bacterium]
MDELIGNTPLIKIKYQYNGKLKEVYIKLEQYNLSGSIKDRMAHYIIKKAYESMRLKSGQTIIEATSGNTGISFCALGNYFNNPVVIFMPDWVSIERKQIMEMYGAKVYLVSKEAGGFKKCIELADELSLKIDGFRPNQFSNQDNVAAHYITTGQEIVDKIHDVGGFVSGIGTGGTLMGIGQKLKEVNPNVILCAVEPDKMPLLTKNEVISNHKIDGIGDAFIPKLVNVDVIDRVLDINDDDAINMAKLLCQKLGLGVGISSGANFLGSVLLNEEDIGKVVSVFSDDNKKYLSTDLSKDIQYNSQFLSNKIELISYEII